MILILFTFLATTVLGQSVLQQQYELRTCISGSPDVLGLTGPFNEGLLPDSCVAVCKQESTDLAFITGGSNTKCYCGNTVPSQNNPPPLVICQSACADGISIGCGSNGLYDGLPAFAVYLINGRRIKTEEPKLSDPLSLLPPAIYVYIGFSAIVIAVVFIISTFAWLARDGQNKRKKTK